jgi:hypothetical protein
VQSLSRASCRALAELRAELRTELRAELRAEPRAGVQTCRCADVQTFVQAINCRDVCRDDRRAIDRLIVWAFVRAIVEPP